jgi:hypothetical protein
MALSITSATRESGGDCDHLEVVVNQEGVSRTFKTSFREIDSLIGEMTTLEQARLLILLWAKYRRSQGRAIVGVSIA